MVTTLTIPNSEVLGGTVEKVETLHEQIRRVHPATRYFLDMAAVDFVRPYGAIALITASRQLAARSGSAVQLLHLDSQVHAHLRFMRLFDIGADWLYYPVLPKQAWRTAAQTPDQLQLTIVVNESSVEAIMARARSIFSHWLLTPNLGSLLNVISELCANIYQHSGDPQGCVLIQKYQSRTRGRVEVRLAVGDLGQGIRGSLTEKHGEFGQEPLDYLRAAMGGRSARLSGRGGMGLRRVEQIVEAEGGYLWLRSETAAILSHGPGKIEERNDLVYVPGTQVAVELHAPYHD